MHLQFSINSCLSSYSYDIKCRNNISLLQEQCETKYETQYDTQCHTEYRTEYETVYEEKCESKYVDQYLVDLDFLDDDFFNVGLVCRDEEVDQEITQLGHDQLESLDLHQL